MGFMQRNKVYKHGKYELHRNRGGLKDVRYSKAQKMLKSTFNAPIQQLFLQLLQKSVQSMVKAPTYC